MKKVRKHFFFYGYVQGVGFRYRACSIASRYGITGWVRNLPDGSVEMEAEGFSEEIDSMIEMLDDDIYISIERTESEIIELKNDYNFSVK